MIRVERDYYPVDWVAGTVFTGTPTVFRSMSSMREVEAEMAEAGLYRPDYKWTKIVEEDR